MAKRRRKLSLTPADHLYQDLLSNIVGLLDGARRTTARSINAVMTAVYWEIGRNLVNHEQKGDSRAEYGLEVVKRLAGDLTQQFGRGYSWRSLYKMRSFYLAYDEILPTVSAKSDAAGAFPNIAHSVGNIPQTATGEFRADKKSQTLSANFVSQLPSDIQTPARLRLFPLPWSHYVRLLALKTSEARQFYETEAIRGGWSVRQLERQIDTQFYERTCLSRNKGSMLEKGRQAQPADLVTVEQEIKDPYVLEFLNLKDEYSESELEEALIANLETFLMELGGDFAFVGRQRRLRIDDEWFRIDLLFFHRRLKSLVIIDLKLGKFTHADAGQMHLYLNYAREHWAVEGENPPIGLILCSSKGETLVKYALEGLADKILAAEYRTALPTEAVLAARLEQTLRRLEDKPATSLNRNKRQGKKTKE